ALLLLVALQLLEMVKNLSPVIRADGYHILADATGVPDLYAHIGPTLRRLLPWRRKEPSALHGRARALVTLWVLVVVPVLLSMMLGAVVMLPRLATTAWDSGRAITAAMPHESALSILASCVRLVALVLPLVGSALVAQRLSRAALVKARGWSGDSAIRQWGLVTAATALSATAAWAWWPSGQYQAIRPTDAGTLVSFAHVIAQPQRAARPAPAIQRASIAPGRHLAVAMIPVGGASRRHPALFVIPGKDGQPAVAVLSASTPDPAAAPTATDPTVTSPAATTTTTAGDAPAPSSQVTATAFPFKLPAPPGPGGNQALAVNTTDHGVVYNVAYTVVTVTGGAPVDQTNTAYALADCRSCTTVAVSFQVVLVVGSSNVVAPIDAAGALNKNCPACATTAIADQIVVTLDAQPSQQVVDQLNAALSHLNDLAALGANGTPAAIAAQVAAVQAQVNQVLTNSGLVAQSTSSTTLATTSTGGNTSATSTPGTGPVTSDPTATTLPADSTTTVAGTSTVPPSTSPSTSPTTASSPTTATTATTGP
ncbi:MAG TPA: hypothetical protein VG435_05905, partial [Acidimicrobiales bacterium]|nr:hypothetical protein [Acidimicrobiales bacterium]